MKIRRKVIKAIYSINPYVTEATSRAPTGERIKQLFHEMQSSRWRLYLPLCDLNKTKAVFLGKKKPFLNY